MQWHPKNRNVEYLSGKLDIPDQAIDHTEYGIKVSVEMASVFVHAARRNRHLYTGKYPWIWDFKVSPGRIFEQLFFIDTFEWNRNMGTIGRKTCRLFNIFLVQERSGPTIYIILMIHPLFGST